MVSTAKMVLVVYGVLMVIGGAMGYQKGSRLSLVSGVGAGLVCLVSSFLMARNPSVGMTLGLIVSFAVGLAMLIRFSKTRAFLPAGMTLVLSIITIVVVTMGLSALRD